MVALTRSRAKNPRRLLLQAQFRSLHALKRAEQDAVTLNRQGNTLKARKDAQTTTMRALDRSNHRNFHWESLHNFYYMPSRLAQFALLTTEQKRVAQTKYHQQYVAAVHRKKRNVLQTRRDVSANKRDSNKNKDKIVESILSLVQYR